MYPASRQLRAASHKSNPLLVDYSQCTAPLPQNTVKVHVKYGEINAPDSAQGPRHSKRVLQSKNWPQNIMNTAGTYHARFRRLLNHAFSEKVLQEQQKLITEHIYSFNNKTDMFAKAGQAIDLSKWFVMVRFDVISDLKRL
ncbi:uncharacterized protein BDW70DRAFT_147682 [Aspergillus foveolatus]|uniref:uncharacterized protein n=1 Tax=Aspergillus foveolatus TaxID=210207 RepID=UPI003CCE4299